MPRVGTSKKVTAFSTKPHPTQAPQAQVHDSDAGRWTGIGLRRKPEAPFAARTRVRWNLRRTSIAQHRLLKDLEVAKRPPEDDEQEDRRQASATKLFCAPTGRNATQQFAHGYLSGAASRVSAGTAF